MNKVAFGVALVFCVCAQGADVSGTIVVKRKLTKSKVTSEALVYGRGTAVELGRDGQGSNISAALSFERSHTVIYLEGQLPAGGASDETLQLGQEHRQFTPDLLVAAAGSTISSPNFDPIFHNVFSLSKARSFDLGNYPKGQTRTVKFTNAGVVFVNCHLHPNMTAAIVVTPNRWAVRAEGNGEFVLKDVPPGKYTAVAWHKTAGFFRHTVEVTEGGAPHLEFVIPLPAADPFPSTAQR